MIGSTKKRMMVKVHKFAKGKIACVTIENVLPGVILLKTNKTLTHRKQQLYFGKTNI